MATHKIHSTGRTAKGTINYRIGQTTTKREKSRQKNVYPQHCHCKFRNKYKSRQRETHKIMEVYRFYLCILFIFSFFLFCVPSSNFHFYQADTPPPSPYYLAQYIPLQYNNNLPVLQMVKHVVRVAPGGLAAYLIARVHRRILAFINYPLNLII